MQRARRFLAHSLVFLAACADADVAVPGQPNELPSARNARAEAPEASEPDALVNDPEIEEMVSAVALSRMSADLSTLVGLRTRNSCSTSSSLTQGIGAARAHVRAQFRAIPISTADDAFTSSFCGSSPVARPRRRSARQS
jgi:hypothetical protein